MKTTKHIMIVLLWIILSNQAFSLTFTTSPQTYTRELEYYDYWITVSGNNGSVTITCEKKPDWLHFDNIYDLNAEIGGIPMVDTYGTNGDSVILKASDSDTTIYQKFAIYVDVVLVAPNIVLEPENVIKLNVEYSDTLVLYAFHPEYLQYEIINMPDFMSFSEIDSPNPGIHKYYALKGYLSTDPGFEDFLIYIKFNYGTSGEAFYSTFSIGNPNNIPYENDDSKIKVISSPFNNEVYIEGVDSDLINDCFLINSSGLKTEIHDLSPINISTVANGTYFLHITLKTGEVLTKKIIKL